jgi:hypothetical protein
MALSPGRIEIHIEELVLHGVQPGDQRAVADALQRELERLVARHGVDALFAPPDVAAEPIALAQQSAAPVSLAPDARPAQLGVEVARAVHRGWR